MAKLSKKSKKSSNKNITTNSSIRGMNIYKDKNGRAIYYDRFTKKGYLVPESDANIYMIYSKRFVIPIIVFVLLYNFSIGGFVFGFLEAFMAAISIMGLMEVLFRMRYLKSLIIVSNFEPTAKEDLITRMGKNTSKGMLIFKAVLYFALGILLILLAYTENYGNMEWLFCGILAAASAVVGIIYLVASFKK